MARLADKAVLFIESTTDQANLAAIGRAVGISAGGIRNWCRTARISPRAFRQFVRALRAVHWHERDPHLTAENLLNIVDRRTLDKFVSASGGTQSTLPATVDDFLTCQRLLVNLDAIAAVRRTLSRVSAR
jgi:hypothetical protein